MTKSASKHRKKKASKPTKRRKIPEPQKILFYLSFVNPNKPKGQRWIGGCYVMATCFMDAVKEAWKHKCNPGGEVAGYDYPDDVCKPEYMNRVLTKEESEKAIS